MKHSFLARTERVALAILVGVIASVAGCQTSPESIRESEPPAGPEPESIQAEGDLPVAVGWVNDFADIIPPEVENDITDTILGLRSSTGSEIAVLTVLTFAPYTTIDAFSIAVATEWGVGSAEREDGVLITVALEERRVRIEVGFGLEDAIPDGVAAQILDEIIIPHLTAGDFGAGLLAGVEAIAERILRAPTR